ncbi:MAG: hypothetical protein GY705_14585 [Bacteroidetes bacterium]|nr:hypothetical protein [Bacteroidota bacterium]
MEDSKILREQIFEIVNSQITNNDPPETSETYQRLIKSGYNEEESKQLIGQCVAVELFNIFKNNQPFNKVRYIRNLSNLPKEPFDD